MRPAFKALCKWYIVSSIALSSATKLINLKGVHIGQWRPGEHALQEQYLLVVDNARGTD